MPDIFVYGTLRHVPLLNQIAGEVPLTRPGALSGYRVATTLGADHPMIVAESGARAEGLICSLSDAGFARLDWYEKIYDFRIHPVQVAGPEGDQPALVWFPGTQSGVPGAPWQLADWVAGWGDLALIAAGEAMESYGARPPDQIGHYWQGYQFRAASALRAQAAPAPKRGSALLAAEVEVLSTQISHAGYFITRTDRLRHPTYAGGLSPVIERETYLCGDACVVLPYDPQSDRVLLTEQFRMGPFRRGARYPWVIEPVAGRIDAGETAEDSARRECLEEAGVTPDALLPVANYYSSSGSTSEYIYTFVGLCDLSARPEGGGGLEHEGEDIRTLLLSFDAAMDLVSSGEAEDGPLILLLLWLQRERPRLRATA
ncbi:NUDIX domain-containing protein [Pseudooceanicola sp.]|uniref:NUDIX domain-containing protein n=1 Tax=Pseudooceanicola sp. TaxID=1914328 RepID=UPI00260E1610|nr:NUDIX domain-containing protein [Pseudooceanicola sp.]MDF1854189.1 NUDIX domain-containing protein [Pseudooceanicola sp.]